MRSPAGATARKRNVLKSPPAHFVYEVALKSERLNPLRTGQLHVAPTPLASRALTQSLPQSCERQKLQINNTNTHTYTNTHAYVCAHVCVSASVCMSFLWMPTSSVRWPASASTLTLSGMSVQLGVCERVILAPISLFQATVEHRMDGY